MKRSDTDTPPVSVRLATADDAVRLAEFNRAMAMETEAKPLPEDVVSAGVNAVFSSEDKGFYVVAESDGNVVGALMVTFEWSDWRNGFFWWIQSVYVNPACRRRGIYRMLYAYVVDRARARDDVYGFRLYVERDNARARKVYQALGMHHTDYLIYEQSLGVSGAGTEK
ncbi:MAG: GNAT family N-acetyltransferase [Gammaproteobacteria bacterium]|nr:GNAT family N-acetyltransferase [Gammaproteobacteria bacterium]